MATGGLDRLYRSVAARTVPPAQTAQTAQTMPEAEPLPPSHPDSVQGQRYLRSLRARGRVRGQFVMPARDDGEADRPGPPGRTGPLTGA